MPAFTWSAFNMPTVTVRNLPAEVHRALRVRAAARGRSTEAEIRDILAQAIRSQGGLRLGTELRRYAEQVGGVELPLHRDPAPIVPASFE
jgi:plasmid stability protein